MAGDIQPITAAALHALLQSDREHALIDVRDVGPFSQSHLLFAVPLPWSRLELLVSDLLPRTSVTVVVCDDGEGLALLAATRLVELGYTDVRLLDGGVSAWVTAGFRVFSGVNVPSKAFGEFVEENEATPSIDAGQLHQWMEAGEDMVILDSRPFEEFNWASIPGGVCCPGAELVYRAATSAPDESTRIIVNCAGRTRSIIGAQSLINAGLANPIFALRNGIMGWRLAGQQPAAGETAWAPPPSAAGRALARQATEKVRDRFMVPMIDIDEFDAWRQARAERTLYVFDVRTIDEFESGRLPDAVHAPGGQLVQATDQYMAVRNARVVLVDNDRVRAVMTASWLIQMGYGNVRVLDVDLASQSLVSGKRTPHVTRDCTAAFISARELRTDSDLVLDFSLSAAYRRAHIPGAWFAQRSRLAECIDALPRAGRLVLTSEDGELARFAAAELQSLVAVPVVVLEGGNHAWALAGNPLTREDRKFAVEPNDLWRNPFSADQAKGETVDDAMRAYLDWEVNLARDVALDGATRFKRFPVKDADSA